MSKIFVDTSAWAAFFNVSDDNHKNAISHWEQIKKKNIPLITSHFIFDELITLLRIRAGYAMAEKSGKTLLESPSLNMLSLEQKHILKAWDFFQKYRDHEFSFTDCTSFILMKEYKVHLAWTYDGDFEEAGFEKFL